MKITDTIVMELGEEQMLKKHETALFKVLASSPGTKDKKVFVQVEYSEINDFVEAIYKVGFSRGYHG